MAGVPFATDRLILCEGIEDAAFLRALILHRALGPFDVRTVEDVCGASGIGAFGRALCACVIQTGFTRVRSLALVADSDEHHGKAFSGLCAQIQRANTNPNVNGLFGIPPNASVASGGHPRITIILNPGVSANGCLEGLLLRAAEGNIQYQTALNCINEMMRCAGISQGGSRWHYSKLEKVRLRTLMAVTNKKNPGLGLGRVWKQYPQFISLANSAFDALEDRLSRL